MRRPGFVRAGANVECVPCADVFFCDGSDDLQHPCQNTQLARPRGDKRLSVPVQRELRSGPQQQHVGAALLPRMCTGLLQELRRQHAVPALHALSARLGQRLDAHLVRRGVRRDVRRVHGLSCSFKNRYDSKPLSQTSLF